MSESQAKELAISSLTEALGYSDTGLFLDRLRSYCIENGGIAELSEKTGLGRNSLYKSLCSDGNPRYSTIIKILTAMGLCIRVEVD